MTRMRILILLLVQVPIGQVEKVLSLVEDMLQDVIGIRYYKLLQIMTILLVNMVSVLWQVLQGSSLMLALKLIRLLISRFRMTLLQVLLMVQKLLSVAI